MDLLNQGNNLTVVIPTLGDKIVLTTIRHLNQGTLVPERIMLCVPERCRLDVSEFGNVELLHVAEKGQVPQRAAGFRASQSLYTLQLDDDILVHNNCLEKLLTSLSSRESAAIAPAFMNRINGNSLYHLDTGGLIKNLYYNLLNGPEGYVQGTVTRAGTCFGVDADQTHETSLVATEWVPGGCLLHRTEDLVLENFYPFSGKAYAEDLIHSRLLTEKGLKLFVNIEARADVDLQPAIATMSFSDFKAFIRDDWRARKYYLQLCNRLSWRMPAYYFVQWLFFLKSRLARSAGEMAG